MNRQDKIFFLGYGLVVWFLATVSFKFIGFDENIMWLNFLLLVVGMPLLNMVGYRWRKVRGNDKAKASALFAFSGMMLDSFIILFYPHIFTADRFSLMPSEGHYLAAWLLFGNSITFLTAIIASEIEARKVNTTRQVVS
ncbi:MAG: DUF5367 family protein [Bacteroidota bacterium]